MDSAPFLFIIYSAPLDRYIERLILYESPHPSHIIFGEDFNDPLSPGVFPEGIEIIYFGYNFNQKIEKGVLPSTVKAVFFGSNFNKKISCSSPLTKIFLDEEKESLLETHEGGLYWNFFHDGKYWMLTRSAPERSFETKHHVHTYKIQSVRHRVGKRNVVCLPFVKERYSLLSRDDMINIIAKDTPNVKESFGCNVCFFSKTVCKTKCCNQALCPKCFSKILLSPYFSCPYCRKNTLELKE